MVYGILTTLFILVMMGVVLEREFKLSKLFNSPFGLSTVIGLVLIIIAIISGNQYLKNGFKEQVEMSASVTTKGVHDLINEKFEQYKLISRAIVNHHQDRIFELSQGAGYPYDLNQISNEIEELFKEVRQFAILDDYGHVQVGSAEYFFGTPCLEHINRIVLNSDIEIDGELHQCDHGSHYDIVINLRRGEEHAAFYVSFYLSYLQALLAQFSGSELQLRMVQGADVSQVVLSPDAIATHQPLEILDESRLQQIIANIQIVDGGWRVIALPAPGLFEHYAIKIDQASWGVFLAVLFLYFVFVYSLKAANNARFKAEQKASYSALFNAGPTLLIEKNLEGKGSIEYVSPNVQQVLGFSTDEVRQNYLFSDLIYSKDRIRFDADLNRAMKSRRRTLEMEFRMLSAGWKYIWVYALMHLDYDAKGKAKKLQGYVTSIHAQKLAEQQATTLINNAPDAILVTNAQGVILQANKRVKAIFGYEGQDLIDVSITVLLPDFERIFNPDSRDIETEQEELEGYTFNGETLTLGVRLNQMQLQPDSKVWAIVMRDISLQKQAQRQMQQAKERAEQLALSRTRFMAMVSHEIRTPMNGVLGMADLLAHTHLSIKQKDYVEVIQQSGDSLMTILNDVLDFSKVEAGGLKLHCEVFDLHKTVESCFNLLQPQASMGQVALKKQFATDCPSHLNGDEMRLRQVVMNLLSNAIKFSPKGEVILSVDSERIDPKNVRLILTFKDNGLGISEADQNQLFQPFTQVDNTLSRSFGGTGLGLSISKQLIELMGGSIAVNSQLGKGSEFTVELPFEVAQAAKKPISAVLIEEKPSPLRLDGQQPRVLLVEDDPVNQKIAESFLQGLGVSVDSVNNGVEAIEFWRMHYQSIDLILMDCQMAIMDGYEATRLIRKEEALLHLTNSVVILAFTADGYAENEVLAKQSGMHDVLVKPLNLTSFNEKIVYWLEQVKQTESDL